MPFPPPPTDRRLAVMALLSVISLVAVVLTTFISPARAAGSLQVSVAAVDGVTNAGAGESFSVDIGVSCDADADGCGVVELTVPLPPAVDFVGADTAASPGWSAIYDAGSHAVIVTHDSSTAMADGDQVAGRVTVEVDLTAAAGDPDLVFAPTAVSDDAGTPAGAADALSVAVVDRVAALEGSLVGERTIAHGGVMHLRVAYSAAASERPLVEPRSEVTLPDAYRLRGIDLAGSAEVGVEVWIGARSGAADTLVLDVAPGSGAGAVRQSTIDALLGADTDAAVVSLRYYEVGPNGTRARVPAGTDYRADLYTTLTPAAPAPGPASGVQTCVDHTTTTVGSTGESIDVNACYRSVITEPEAVFYPESHVSRLPLEPGDERTIRLDIRANSTNAVGLTDPVLFELLPPGVEFLRFVGTTTIGTGISVAPDPNLELVEMGDRQLVRFSWSATPSLVAESVDGGPAVPNPYTLQWTAVEQLAAESFTDPAVEVEFVVRVRDDAVSGAYQFLAGASTSAPAASYCPEGTSYRADADNLDGDASTADTTCTLRKDIQLIGNDAPLPEFDQALRKRLDVDASPDLADGVDAGDVVTFTIEVTNQADAIESVTVVDYIDASLFEPFDPARNPAMAIEDSGDADPFGTSWDAADPYAPQVTVVAASGVLATDEVVTVPITLVIASDWSGTGAIENWAEIANFDDDVTSGGDAASGDLVDRDSTPNDTFVDDNRPAGPGALGDDHVDGDGRVGGDPVANDEDDHDVAGIASPTYSLGNQVWYDPDDDGRIDAGEVGVDGVRVELYTDSSCDGTGGVFVDAAVTGSIDLDLSGDVDPTTEQGLYLFDDLTPGCYVVVIPASNFEAGTPLAGWWSSTPTSATPNDDVDGDDNGIATESDVRSGSVEVGPASPLAESPDNDPVTPDAHENLTVDFGFTRYSVGNLVWFDEDNDGRVGADEDPIADVWVELFTDADGDGVADDRNDDGRVDTDDAIATTGTDSDGLYLFDGLAPGDYVVGIPPMEWTDGGPLDGLMSSDPTVADPNTDADNDDNGIEDVLDGYVVSGAVTIGDNEPDGESPDNDPHTHGLNENLTVDFGFWEPRFDLALRKQLEDGTNSAVVELGQEVTFVLTVLNQGNVAATDITLVDYLPAGLELADDAWTLDADGVAAITVPGVLDPGASVQVEITTIVRGAGLVNEAEISGATPVSSTGGLLVLPNGEPPVDDDSTPDADNTEEPVDDEVDNGNGDEDDHDVAALSLEPPTTDTGGDGASGLARSGSNSRSLAGIALAFVAFGSGLVLVGRRLYTPRHAR